MQVPPHVEQAAVALDDVKLLYVPVPKAASTAILWALAESEGIADETFLGSTKLEVTRALTVHDMTLWEPARRLLGRGERELEEIFLTDEWLRFTVVREPVRRLWSTWVTKILVRDPRFVAMFGSAEWFPPPPRGAEDVVEGFRRFVSVLGRHPTPWHDPHWLPQADLLGVDDLAYHVLGRVEDVPRALAVVDGWLEARGRGPLRLRRENASLLPFSPGLLDRESAEACSTWTARDREAFGYEPMPAGAGLDERWRATVEAALRDPGGLRPQRADRRSSGAAQEQSAVLTSGSD